MQTSPIPTMEDPTATHKIHTLPPEIATSWWRQAAYYIGRGITICRKDIPGLITLVGLFVLPSLAAVLIGQQSGALAYWAATALPWITMTLGNIMAVLAIEAIDAGKPVTPNELLPAAIRWLPRYLWTNGITTLLFWGIFTPLQWLLDREGAHLGWPSLSSIAILLIPGLFWHVRLVFATYAAIVDDHPAIPSVIISMKVAQKRWLMVVAAFVGSVLVEAPIAGPLYLLIQVFVHKPVVAEAYTWVLVMPMRPLFIATLHAIYHDYRPVQPGSRRYRSLRSLISHPNLRLLPKRWDESPEAEISTVS